MKGFKNMATIYTYKDAKTTEQGLWIKSVDDGPEVYLDRAQALKLAEQIIMTQARSAVPARRSAPVAQRSAPTVQRSAPVATKTKPKADPNRITGTKEFTGKMGFFNENMKQYAMDRAKYQAVQKYEQYMASIKAEGKACNCNAKGQSRINGNNAFYTVTAVLT